MSAEQIDQTIEQQQTRFETSSSFFRAAHGIIGDRMAIDIYIAVEIATIFVMGVLLGQIYVADILGVEGYFHAYLAPLTILPFVAAFNINRRGHYTFAKLYRFPNKFAEIASAIAISFVVLVLAGFAARVANDYSRVWFVGWCALSICAVAVMRTLAAHLLRGLSATGVIQKTVAIYGDGPAVQEVAAALWRSRTNVRLAGIFGPSNDGAKSRNGANALKDLVAFAQARPIDTVILAIPGADARSLKPLLMELSVLPGEVQLYTGIDGGRIALRGVSMLDRLTLLDVQRKPISGWGLLAKAVEDYVVAALALILALPLFAVIAAAVKLDSDGPVFFLQRRHGFNHKIIRVWKFRTMRVMEDGDVVPQARQGDARITRVGAFLRRTSLDELPQLINVLKGEMSVVGPRPHALAHNVAYIGLLARYQERHRVKPGITGWAQVHGYRGPTEDAELMRKRVEYDLEYIENWSLWLDLKIIAATPIVGLFQKNAI